MELGIFAKTFARPTLGATLDAVAAHGLTCVQFNMACVGLPTLPDRIDEELCDRIGAAFQARSMRMAAVSGTFNLIHPDLASRHDGLGRLRVLVSACRRMGTAVVTLCTGTRDPDDMWKRHPDNDSAAAWRDLIGSLRLALEGAEEHNVTLAFEPETTNVIDSAPKARRLLNEVGSERLKVVIDPVNLLTADRLPRMREIMEEAFEILGSDIVMAHAKDKTRTLEDVPVATGRGVLDFDLYLKLLHCRRGDIPLILHGLDESQVAQSIALLNGKAEREAR